MYDKKVGFVCPLHLHVLGFCKRAYLAIKEVVFIVTQYALHTMQYALHKLQHPTNLTASFKALK